MHSSQNVTSCVSGPALPSVVGSYWSPCWMLQTHSNLHVQSLHQSHFRTKPPWISLICIIRGRVLLGVGQWVDTWAQTGQVRVLWPKTLSSTGELWHDNRQGDEFQQPQHLKYLHEGKSQHSFGILPNTAEPGNTDLSHRKKAATLALVRRKSVHYFPWLTGFFLSRGYHGAWLHWEEDYNRELAVLERCVRGCPSCSEPVSSNSDLFLLSMTLLRPHLLVFLVLRFPSFFLLIISSSPGAVQSWVSEWTHSAPQL